MIKWVMAILLLPRPWWLWDCGVHATCVGCVAASMANRRSAVRQVVVLLVAARVVGSPSHAALGLHSRIHPDPTSI